MKDFDALKSIWQDQAELSKVSHDDVLKKIKGNKSTLATRLLIELLGIGMAAAVLGFVWVQSPFRLWTTHLAMVVFFCCCIYYIVSLIQTYRRITDAKLMDTPEQYIDYLKKYKSDRYIFNTRKYRNYSLLITLAFLLYFIEIAFLAELWVTIVAVVFTALWIGFCYFYLMGIYIRKEETKLEEMIQNLGRLRGQFEDSE